MHHHCLFRVTDCHIPFLLTSTDSCRLQQRKALGASLEFTVDLLNGHHLVSFTSQALDMMMSRLGEHGTYQFADIFELDGLHFSTRRVCCHCKPNFTHQSSVHQDIHAFKTKLPCIRHLCCAILKPEVYKDYTPWIYYFLMIDSTNPALCMMMARVLLWNISTTSMS